MRPRSCHQAGETKVRYQRGASPFERTAHTKRSRKRTVAFGSLTVDGNARLRLALGRRYSVLSTVYRLPTTAFTRYVIDWADAFDVYSATVVVVVDEVVVGAAVVVVVAPVVVVEPSVVVVVSST